MAKGNLITIGMNVTGTKMLMAAMHGLTAELYDIMINTYEKVAQHYVMNVKSKRLKRTCHSLEDLAELGHPYSTKYPSNMLRKGAGSSRAGSSTMHSTSKYERFAGMNAEAVLGHDLTKIHKQGMDGIYKAMTYEIRQHPGYYVSALAGIEAGHDSEEYAGFVFYGTSKMIKRPALEEVLTEMKADLIKKQHVFFAAEFWKAVNRQPFFKKGRR